MKKVTYTISKSRVFFKISFLFKLFQKVPLCVNLPHHFPLIKYINCVFSHPVPVSAIFLKKSKLHFCSFHLKQEFLKQGNSFSPDRNWKIQYNNYSFSFFL